MTKIRKILAVISWALAAIGGGWGMLALMAAYLTTTGFLQLEDVVAPLAVALVAVLLALGVHLAPKKSPVVRIWPWCVPVYVVAGGPLVLIVTTWLDQHFNK